MRSAVPEQSDISSPGEYNSGTQTELGGLTDSLPSDHLVDGFRGRARRFIRFWLRSSNDTADVRLMAAGVTLFAIAVAIFVAIYRDDPLRVFKEGLLFVPAGLLLLVSSVKWFVPILALLLISIPPELRLVRLSRAIQVTFGCAVFMSLFVIAKAVLIFASPFRFDAAFEHLDRIIHFGIRPLELTQALSPYISPGVVSFFYMSLWPMPAFFFPLILVLVEPEWGRRRRFILLYFFVFVGLGLIFALLGMSAGPVYHDQLVAEARFADLPAFQQQSGLDTTGVAALQNLLWNLYSNDIEAASGISAFPSVHVAMAMVFGLYVWERWKWLRPIAVAIPLWYQFLSVYTGWHYAVDGYFSIIAVWAAWCWLSRRGNANPLIIDSTTG